MIVGGDAYGAGADIWVTGSELLNDTIYGNSSIGGATNTEATTPEAGYAYGGGVTDDTFGTGGAAA